MVVPADQEADTIQVQRLRRSVIPVHVSCALARDKAAALPPIRRYQAVLRNRTRNKAVSKCDLAKDLVPSTLALPVVIPTDPIECLFLRIGCALTSLGCAGDLEPSRINYAMWCLSTATISTVEFCRILDMKYVIFAPHTIPTYTPAHTLYTHTNIMNSSCLVTTSTRVPVVCQTYAAALYLLSFSQSPLIPYIPLQLCQCIPCARSSELTWDPTTILSR
jgi:hypothetical protein